jgi:uncharacterized protein YfaS (alpha-2-macroglobulin family)
MHTLNRHLPKIVLVFFCLLCCKISSAQNNNYNNIIFRIDSLEDVALPKSALKEVDKLDALAHKENNAPQMIRAVIYRLKFKAYLEDDAMINIITTLKTDIDQASYPVKPVLQSFLADMYWNYYADNRQKFAGRSRLEKPDVDFRNWDLATLINETSRLYNQSLTDAEKEQNTPVDILDGILKGDKHIRYLRPSLYDLLLHRAFDYFLADEPAIITPKFPFNINDDRFFSNSGEFAQINIKSTDTNSTIYQGIKLLQQATAYHLQKNNRAALADLDLKRLDFLHDKSQLSNKDSIYLATLKSIAADTAAGVIVADALNKIGGYYSGKDSLTTAMYYFQKAVHDYPKSIGAYSATSQIIDITQKQLEITIEDVNPAGVPLTALLKYRNIKAVAYKVYKVTEAQSTLIQRWNALGSSKQVLSYLDKIKPLQQQLLNLPPANDLQQHSTEFKIDPLKPGTYRLVTNQTNLKDSLWQLATFKISNLAYILRTRPDRKRELRVLNRENGEPVNGANVIITYRDRNSDKVKPIIFKGTTDTDGVFIFNDASGSLDVDIDYHNDYLSDKDKYQYYSSQPILNSTPQLSTVFFTDRRIYRPGQTIYFKALQLQEVGGKSSIVPGADIAVELRDGNNKQLATINVKTNEFGSASGSFIIPQNMLNGQVRIAAPKGYIYLRVEEYKRPTFKAEFEPFTENYKLNDSITVKGKVNAFSGYGLSGARVAYRVTRNVSNRIYDNEDAINTRIRFTQTIGAYAEIVTDTIKTDQQGRFEFKFLASSIKNAGDYQAYTYSIGTTITDAADETQTANTEISLSNKPISILVDLPSKIFTKNGVDAAVNIFNSSQQKQNGKATIQIYALNSPGLFFKSRLWDAPDKWMLSQNEYHQYLPGFAYNHEDEYQNWKRGEKVADIIVPMIKTGNNNINPDKLLKLTGGIYLVAIKAEDEAGDTISTTRYVNIIADKATVQKTEDWVLPVNTSVMPNQAAEFYVSVGNNGKVLFETYDGPKVLSSQWLVLPGNIVQKIEVPVPHTDRNSFGVQFITLNGNRQYQYYQRIVVKDTLKNLAIKFLTMRNKLLPGQKEQWQLQISGSNHKQNAELLADMYDASLDEIASPLSWRTNFKSTSYLAPYYQWDYATPSAITGSESSYQQDLPWGETEHKYESINMLGFNYNGGDNYYFGYSRPGVNRNGLSDKSLSARYKKNAALINNGFDVVGKVTKIFYGVKVRINNSQIYTFANSLGYFKIRVPYNSKLIFSSKGLKPIIITPQKGERIFVDFSLQIADPGVKSQKGDPNQEIRIDEPVGNADVKEMVEEDANVVKRYNGYVQFPPPVVKYDKEKIVLREIQTKPGQKYNKELLIRSAREIGASDAPITIRKNFNETGFFYPQLHTDSAGRILIDFTVPESLTRWKFRGLAHNKQLQTGYIEQEVITQKKLMISANTPRFLREGDTLTLSARVVNLSDKPLKGKTHLEIFNALTMQPVNLFSKAKDAEQSFELDSMANKAVSYKLIIPVGLEAVTYRITAAAGNYTDGEENTLPVLPNRLLVTETMPMMVRGGQTKEFKFDKLINPGSNTIDNKTLTLEYTQNPAWTAIQAIPYLMEFPYECSEQVFSRYYANSFATAIISHNPQIKQVFEQWKNTDSKALLSNLEKNQELKSVLLEETPWLQDALTETEQRKRIALLFDLNKMSYELSQNLDKLKKKQLPNGAFPWFGGNDADRYITQHVLAGIGQLNKLGIATNDTAALNQVGNAALGYLSKQLIKDENESKKINKQYLARPIDALETHAWYALSYFKGIKLSAELDIVKKNYVNRAITQWAGQTEFEKAMIALTLYRWGNKETAGRVMKSLLETARQTDELGMYWANNQPGYYWYQSPIETQALMIELFTEAGSDINAVNEMKMWLLCNKQTNNWGTTKASAAACYALLMKGDNILTGDNNTQISIDNKPLEQVKPNAKEEAGTGFIKTTWVNEQVKPSLGNVKVTNAGKNISWGAMYWQYTEKLDKITPSNTNVKLQRKYFIKKQTDNGPVLTAVDASHQPKTGDILKVVVYLDADRDFDYIQLKDMRPAGTEPIEAISTYKYQDGLYYYQVSKDVATNFFISMLPKGHYVFEYELRVAQPGNYATGVTSLQSMYAPEFNAHSEGQRMRIVEAIK